LCYVSRYHGRPFRSEYAKDTIVRGGIVTWKGVRRTKSKYSSHYPFNHPTKLELSMPAFDVSTNICAGVVCRIQIYNYNLIHTADTVSLPPPSSSIQHDDNKFHKNMTVESYIISAFLTKEHLHHKATRHYI
jgi:hypothetical protein